MIFHASNPDSSERTIGAAIIDDSDAGLATTAPSNGDDDGLISEASGLSSFGPGSNSSFLSVGSESGASMAFNTEDVSLEDSEDEVDVCNAEHNVDDETEDDVDADSDCD
ncbi:hypothetical protein EW145_g7391 [Phellinidium pouzarii]|uniref:Uncharacterized protein n=1 Tax=Phellinidium pouzarii TaxID=167371 RepID=A0A4S4KKW5_9AGAM|nr:hypothetical protein EW145_g7391 [Phellinidium pouzarii]